MIEYVATGGIARLTLNRPEKRNALNPALIAAVEESLDRASRDPQVRVVLLRGFGADFCAGMDLAGILENPNPGVLDHLEDARRVAGLYLAMKRCARPVIAAVQGRALGGGCGLVTAADLAVAAESAQFRYSEINLGFVPAIVMSLLRRSVGEKQAFEMLVSGESVSAAEAHRLGMINHVFPDSDFDAQVEEYAAHIAAKSASALALTKNLMRHIDGMSLEQAVESGVFVNSLARGTADARRGIEQFVHKK